MLSTTTPTNLIRSMACMQKRKVTDTIEFAYYDSGPPPSQSTYQTIIIFNGHTYHSGVLMPMLEKAHAFDVRVILVNRRLYPGSTPYTKEEVDAFQVGSPTEDRTKVFFKQGEYLLLFLNNIIADQSLKNVCLVGWSLGTAFLNVTVASIVTIGEEIQSRLRKSVKSIVWWDPPASLHGLPDPPTGGWIPLYDLSLTPEERGQAFGEWVVQYFPHENLDKKDCNGLLYTIATPIRRPTFSGMPIEELLLKVDLTAGRNGDDIIGDDSFRPIVTLARERAIFDEAVRSKWDQIPFIIIYGNQSPYNIQWAVWKLLEEAERTRLPVRAIEMLGANHFAFVDDIGMSFETLKSCI